VFNSFGFIASMTRTRAAVSRPLRQHCRPRAGVGAAPNRGRAVRRGAWRFVSRVTAKAPRSADRVLRARSPAAAAANAPTARRLPAAARWHQS
jgi:hypothetical protein